jgi:hypothetical protein
MTKDLWSDPDDWRRHRAEPYGPDDAPPWAQPPTLATGLPEWDLLPPTEFVQRPRGRL